MDIRGIIDKYQEKIDQILLYISDRFRLNIEKCLLDIPKY